VSRVVLKLGGAVAGEVAADALQRVAAGDEVVVVHGAGPQISAELRARGIPVEFVDGRRVTSREVLEVVRASLAQVGAEIAAALGPDTIQLAGDAIGLRARPVPELGLVGTALPSCPPAVLDALEHGRIPVVSPLAAGPLNVNADDAAGALAVGIGADRLVFVSDVPGVLLDGSVASRLSSAEADSLLSAGAFEGGIVPKLMAAVRAARLGVRASIGATEVLA
jgi:acetylglutamate kinase